MEHTPTTDASTDPGPHQQPRSVDDMTTMEHDTGDAHASTSPRKNLILLLPPEVRNEIYEDVLRNYRKVHDPSYRLRFFSKGRAQLDQPYPPLLLVCKQIRADSLPMFFAMNKFRLVMNMNQLDRVQQWLSTLEADNTSPLSRASPLGRVALSITACSWLEIERLSPLAEFARNHNVRDIRFTGNRRHIRKALQDIVALGRRARKENWSPDWLKEMFARWSKRTFKKSSARTALERANLKLAAHAKGEREEAGADAEEDCKEVLALGGPVSDDQRRTRARSGSK